MNLLIVGSVATDSIETPLGKVDSALGGSATYSAVAASYFTKTGLVAVVGNDFEENHIGILKDRGIDLEGLQIDNQNKTFHWSGYYEGDMNQAITRETHLNAFEKFQPVIPDNYKNASHVLLGNISPRLQLEVLEQVNNPKMVLCDTMNFYIDSEPELLKEVFSKVDIICINDGEARQFCETSSLTLAAEQLLKLGARYVIIKKGAHGALLFWKDGSFALPGLPLVTVKDPTGAGDSFAGGTLGYLAKIGNADNDHIRGALVAGTVMASYCVEDFSCDRTRNLSKIDIGERAAWLREFARIPEFDLE
jgi:sugar/nucleoside kinase (ribokinase family)